MPQSVSDAIRTHSGDAVIPFVVGCYPDPHAFSETLRALSEAGAPVIEVGFPFSDPIADGPVIAQAMHGVINGGTDTDSIFERVQAVRSSLRSTLVAMVSISILSRIGYDSFAQRAASSGFDAVLVPDAPLDEAEPIIAATSSHQLQYCSLIAPSTPPDRASDIAASCTGFVYLLARAGITGSDSRVTHTPPQSIIERINPIRPTAKSPIACGFGISTRQDVVDVLAHADAAIVGTALVKTMRDSPSDPAEAARSLYCNLCGQ